MKFNPDPTYNGLLKQAYSLHRLADSYERQNLELYKRVEELKNIISFIGEDAINAERSTNEMLTNELAKIKALQDGSCNMQGERKG